MDNGCPRFGKLGKLHKLLYTRAQAAGLQKMQNVPSKLTLSSHFLSVKRERGVCSPEYGEPTTTLSINVLPCTVELREAGVVQSIQVVHGMTRNNL